MYVLGFTDTQIEALYKAESWNAEEQRGMLEDAARPGGFERIYSIYKLAGGKRDREGYLIYFADAARDRGMLSEALAMLRQASNAELASMHYRSETSLRGLIEQVQQERSMYTGRLKLVTGLGFVGIISASIAYTTALYYRDR